MNDQDQQDGVRKVAELVQDARVGMLTTMTESGKHVSRPMALQEIEFDGDLWFFADQDSAKVREIQHNPEVNIAFSDGEKAWTSVSGAAALVQDRQRMEELWAAPLEVWFPDGLDTPGIALIRVVAETAEWWEASGSKAKRLIGAVRAAVTGDPDKFPAENATERLT